MAEQAALSFGGLLRQLRAEARLTQEELAEAAQLSPRSVSDLERGVNRTSRKDTAELLADALGLTDPVHGVFVAAARGRVPAAEVLAARVEAPYAFAGNLPVELSSFIGRAEELADLVTAIRRASLVTVTGVGGVGKTRLALHAAARQLPSLRDGAWLCELHAATDAQTMAQAVLAALRVRPRPGISMASSIVEFLRTKSALLLVVDNCEHLPSAAAALVADILRRCRGVRILATSRQALGVSGEQVFGLRPLSLPPPEASMATVSDSDAVSLFVQRATAVRSDFSLSSVNVAAVSDICRRLDGIPLAIELAAARVAAMRPTEIAELLDERFRLLTRGRADAAGRHQTLQATVEWSYALTENGQTCQLAFRIVAALASSALSGRGAVGVWAEACIPQISSCPPETRAAVIAAAAWSAFFAGDLPLAQRRAEDALREPASSDWSSLGMPRGLLSRIYALTGQPERGARIAREGRQEAATRGIEVLAGYFHAMEALA